MRENYGVYCASDYVQGLAVIGAIGALLGLLIGFFVGKVSK